MKRKRFCAAWLLVMAVLLLAGCGQKAAGAPTADEASAQAAYTGIADLAGKRIGTVTGTALDKAVKANIPDCQMEYFIGNPDLVQALKGQKIEAFVTDEPLARKIANDDPSLCILGKLASDSYGFIFPKDAAHEKYIAQMNEFLAQCRADGTLEAIDTIWFGADPARQVVDMSGLTGENGTLNIAVSSSMGDPFLYIKDGQYAGYEVDVLVRFCRAYGYQPEFSDANFNGVLAAVSSGRADIGAASISITEERRQSMAFSDAHYVGGVVLITLRERTAKTADQAENAAPEDMAGKHIGVVTGSIFDRMVEELYPGCVVEYYNTDPDLAIALDAGKLDAYVVDEPIFRFFSGAYPDQRILKQISEDEYAYIFPKGSEKHEKLRGQMDEFLAKAWEDGTIDALRTKWMDSVPGSAHVDYSGLTGENGTLTFATNTDSGASFSMIVDGEFGGYEVDLLVQFCKEYGYDLKITDSSFDGILAAVTAGKADLGASSIAITEERKESMLFSTPDYHGGAVLIVEGDAKKAETSDIIRTLDDLADKRIGVVTGMIFDQVAREQYPECQVMYYNAYADVCEALAGKKIDAYIGDEPIIRKLVSINPDQFILGKLMEDQYGFIFPKDEAHRGLWRQMNEFIARCRADGTMDELDDIWFSTDTARQHVDISGLTGENGILTVAINSGSGEPFLYMQDGEIVGYEVDLIARFCREYGYALHFRDSNFVGVLSAVTTGKADIGASCISVTDERKESMLFSDAHYVGGVAVAAMVQRKDDAKALPISAEQMAGKRIGILTGSVYDKVAKEHIPDAQLEFYNTMGDQAVALQTGKLDAYLIDEPLYRSIASTYPDQISLGQVTEESYAFILPKGSEKHRRLREDLCDFLGRCRADGTLDALAHKWLDGNADRATIDLGEWEAPNGTLELATCTEICYPFTLVRDGTYGGYDIELLQRFCKENGYQLKISDYSFAGLLSAVTVGKADIGAGCVIVTEERKGSLLFTDPDYYGGVLLIGMREGVDGKTSIFSGILSSFKKTFIRESRWKLFVSGIGVTLLITTLATLFGTALGFGLYRIYRKRWKPFVIFLNVLIDILEKTPVVVILMILYYIIFGKANLEGMWVAVVGFTVMFACSFVSVMRVAVLAVDKGQWEASLALGFTDTQCFLKIILPQAAKHFLPGYKGQIVALLKDTAIVGYIAVQDLTKVGDIVRSRTYEAFFPLIVTAVIYFLLAWGLTLIVRHIEFSADATHRSREKILKGVQTK